ncbi:MAG TPA: hypothetical protein PL041_13275, partial [Melioribacteraceae bacterium]|nr:hypothetical protein [Melioribacteraceae bacterium]
ELMAEESAERERTAKEEETEGGEETSRPKRKPVRFKDRRDRRPNFGKKADDEQTESTSENTETTESETATQE